MLTVSPRRVAAALVASAFAIPVQAQWPIDPAQNLLIANKINEQTQSKIKPLAGGGSYISWFDNAAGGYDVYLQRLDADGVAQWPANGVLIADRSFSSTQDYGLDVDGDGNAVLAFRDDRFGGVHITVNIITPDGTLAWGSNGVQATLNGSSPNSPRVAALSDGSYVVGWSEGNATKLQRLDSKGQPQWIAGGIALTPSNGMGSYSLSDIQSSDNGSAIILIVRPVTTFTSNKHLYSQKFDAAGNALWNSGSPRIIYDSGSVQNGYFPTFISDGAGGAAYGWYENSNPRNCYVQRVNAAGDEVFPHGGVAVATSVVIRLSPAFAYNAATGDIFMFYIETNAAQSMWSINSQKFNSAGARQWSDAGKLLVPLSGNQPSFLQSVIAGDGAMAFCFDRSGNAQVIGTRLDGAGNFVWPGNVIPVCSVLSGKSRLAATLDSQGSALLSWGDGRNITINNPGNDIYAQNVNQDGTLGPISTGKPGDINGDDIVDVDDLLAVINAWGECKKGKDCIADISPPVPPVGDGVVDVDDLLLVINNWS
jgi:hypothetical protein